MRKFSSKMEFKILNFEVTNAMKRKEFSNILKLLFSENSKKIYKRDLTTHVDL